MKPWREHGYIPHECNDCSELSECKGGCRFAAYEEGQPLDTKDYRMTKAIKTKKSIKVPGLNPNDEYISVPFKYRKERENQYTLNSKSKLLFANKGTIDFLEAIQKKGYLKISEIPEGRLREKASELTKILLNKKFLKIR